MEDTVYRLVHEHKSLELGIGSIEKFKQAFKAFAYELDNCQDADIAYIMDMHYEVLSKVRIFVKEKHMGNAVLKNLHDQVFLGKLDFPRKQTASTVTKLFEEFVKGITYFKHQIDPSNPVPIYHRFFSCGIGNEIYRGNNLVCTKNISLVEKKRRRPLIERCYMERLIYDALYRHETLHFPLVGSNADHTKDKGHMFRIDLTKADYESCFKGHSVEINIIYHDKYPVTLVITRKKNGIVLYKEEYTHELRGSGSIIAPYTGIIICKRVLGNGKVYLKTQDFSMEHDWRLKRD